MFRQDVTCLVLLVPHLVPPPTFSIRDYHPLWSIFPDRSDESMAIFRRLFRFRSPLLSESRLFSLPPGTEMVHFPGFARTRLWIHRAVRRFYPRGFPHSEIPGSKPACGSPRLIAACHVLHRLLLPRHPPCALSSLTIKFTCCTRAVRRSLSLLANTTNTSSNLMAPSVHRTHMLAHHVHQRN